MGRSGNVVSSPMSFSSPNQMEHYDISRLVRIEQHRLRDHMQTFSRTPGLAHAERATVAADFVRACAATIAAEQAVLLPLLRSYADGSGGGGGGPGVAITHELVDRAYERRQGVLRALEALDSPWRPRSPCFDAKLERCWVLLSAAHVETDQRLLPALDRRCGWEQRERHGRRFYLYRLLLAPTRPHSWVPAEVGGGWLGAACNAALAPVDWAKDALRFGLAMPL